MFDKSLCVSVPPNLEEIPAGAELASVLESLDYDSLSPFDLVRVLKAQQRLVAHYQAASYWSMDRLVTAYQNPDDLEDPKDMGWAVEGAVAEIGAALTLTRTSAEYETWMAIDLSRRMPKVWLALLQGRIDMRRARVLVAETIHVADDVARAAIDTIIDDAPGLTTGQLKARLRKLCIDADPDAARERYERSVADRRFVIEANDSGTANILNLDVPPHIANSVGRWIHREALKLKNNGDQRTMDQLRSDIGLDLLRRRYKGKKVTRSDFGILDMKVTGETLTGQSDESAVLNGFGPILADIARQVAEHQEQTERRWSLIDPDTGQPIDGGITRRKPTASQRRMAETLHPTCIHPGCRMPAVDCDIDHRVPYSDQPVTCTCELGPMCRHHHVIRHEYGWSYDLIDGGDFLFTSPFGHQYRTSGKPVPNAQSP
jgi:hypothetical protein